MHAAVAAAVLKVPLRKHRPDQPFRIAMVAACPMPARRGTPLRVERLAEALSGRGHRVELITYHVADGPQALEFPVHRIFRHPLYWRMPAGPNLRKLFVYDPALACKLWRVLAEESFDIIHAHHLEGLLVALPARIRHRIPIVYDAHTMLSFELPSYTPTFSRAAVAKLGEWLDGMIPRGADHIAAVTPDIRNRLIEQHGMPPESISVVMNGVETGSFEAEAPPGDGEVRLIYTGTLAPYQDVDLLLEAFATARRVRSDLRLCFSVSSPFQPYEEKVSRLGIREAIEVLPDGFSELPRRLAACSIAVLPRTQCPGIPQKLLNYMAAGKAIVASAGSAKLLEHERTGLVVPNGDVQAFAQAMLRLAGNESLARELGRRAREHVERTCSWEHSAEQLEQIYEQIAPLGAAAV